ncbi:hypothetical protein MHYP_G00303520 [Metynnis hypsauchen]
MTRKGIEFHAFSFLSRVVNVLLVLRCSLFLPVFAAFAVTLIRLQYISDASTVLRVRFSRSGPKGHDTQTRFDTNVIIHSALLDLPRPCYATKTCLIECCKGQVIPAGHALRRRRRIDRNPSSEREPAVPSRQPESPRASGSVSRAWSQQIGSSLWPQFPRIPGFITP